MKTRTALEVSFRVLFQRMWHKTGLWLSSGFLAGQWQCLLPKL